MKNSVADRQKVQSSCAGLFIAAHLGFDYPGTRVHVDMTTPVHCGERATGYGLALLLTLVGGHTDSNLRWIGAKGPKTVSNRATPCPVARSPINVRGHIDVHPGAGIIEVQMGGNEEAGQEPLSP
nr:probable aminopeptidase NPEPL1 [Drosophila simulans]